MLVWRWDTGGCRWAPAVLETGARLALDDHTALVSLVGARCALLAQNGVLVNGLRSLPFRVLADRDEISAGGQVFYVCTEAAAEPASFNAENKKVRCGRCLGRLTDGEQVVRCPQCRAHYHAGCWAYAPDCARCQHTTAGVSWIPEDLE